MEDNKKYYIRDIESGWAQEVSKEQHEQYMKMWSYFSPKLMDSDKVIGRIICTGTKGEMDNDWGKELFMYNQNLKNK